MADSKVTDFAAATSVNSADVMYVIQNNTDKKITVSTLLANLPNTLTKFAGLVAVDGTEQTIINNGTINGTSSVAYISNTQNSSLVLDNGLHNGQLKFLIMTSGTHSSMIISNIAGVASLTLSQRGHTAILMWVSSQNAWFLLGGNANVVT